MTSALPLLAAFPSCLGAHDAEASLRESGFHDIWVGVTMPDASIKSMLVRRGVEKTDAQRAAHLLRPDDVVLIVDAGDYPELAAGIIAEAGGSSLCGDTFFCAAPPAPRATVPVIDREVDLSGVVRLSERRKAPRHLTPYKQVS